MGLEGHSLEEKALLSGYQGWRVPAIWGKGLWGPNPPTWDVSRGVQGPLTFPTWQPMDTPICPEPRQPESPNVPHPGRWASAGEPELGPWGERGSGPAAALTSSMSPGRSQPRNEGSRGPASLVRSPHGLP